MTKNTNKLADFVDPQMEQGFDKLNDPAITQQEAMEQIHSLEIRMRELKSTHHKLSQQVKDLSSINLDNQPPISNENIDQIMSQLQSNELDDFDLIKLLALMHRTMNPSDNHSDLLNPINIDQLHLV